MGRKCGDWKIKEMQGGYLPHPQDQGYKGNVRQHYYHFRNLKGKQKGLFREYSKLSL